MVLAGAVPAITPTKANAGGKLPLSPGNFPLRRVPKALAVLRARVLSTWPKHCSKE